jgi:hypothetical protein
MKLKTKNEQEIELGAERQLSKDLQMFGAEELFSADQMKERKLFWKEVLLIYEPVEHQSSLKVSKISRLLVEDVAV